jgi:RHS repeat-associated protein
VNSTPAIAASQYNGFNQLLAVSGPSGTTSFAYDGNGNQVSRTDGLGTTTYAYSYDNRLVGITGPGGSSHFEYDANGLRTKKADSSGTRSYLLDGLSVVAEYAPDASRLAWYTQSLARIDEVLSVVNGQGKYWYETDALGSTYAMTSTAGAVVSRSSYDVFGERTVVTANDVAQPFGFTGRELDPTGLVYARARYLQPEAGRWTQPDPLGFVAGPAFYLYVHSRPTNVADPTGLFAPSPTPTPIPVVVPGIGKPRVKTTLEAYAEQHWLAFLWVMADLGVISAAVLVANQKLYEAKRVECEDDDSKPLMYYRGLSVGDAKEFAAPPFQISSKMARAGGDIADGFARHSDPAAARAHGLTSMNSPYVGVTLSLQIARDFAKGRNVPPRDLDDAPSGIVVAFFTARPPARPGLVHQQEYLFFWSIGIPGETIIPIEQHTPNWP